MARFRIGDVYYRLTYPEPKFLYPLIETFVFIGKNLSEKEEKDTWYFQFARGFAKHGSVLKSKGGDRKVCCLNETEAKEMLGNGTNLSTRQHAALVVL